MIEKELEKLNWMKNEYIKECKRMLDLIDKQEAKVEKLAQEGLEHE